ncbi:Signal transduction histidine kinase [Halanaeroarchaeum sp. HSR-CO]|nr:Signal transduction histidine kinase [Halanaeroarchaeum sp. HSR-CO]
MDDDPRLSELTGTHLERIDTRFSVTTETNPDRALERLSTTDFDAVLTDYDMPEMNGIAVTEAIRERWPVLPVVLFTGKGSEEVASDAFAAGVTDYLQKGVGTDQYQVLANRLANAIDAAAAQRQRRRYERAMEASGHAILVTDRDGTIEYVNPAFEEITGYAADEAIGRTPRILKSGEHDTPFYEGLWETILDGEIVEHELTNRRKSGERYPVDQTIAPITDDAGAITGFVAVNADRSRRQAEQRERALLRRAIDKAHTALVLTDPRAPDNPIVYVNDAFEELTGYDAETAEGRNCRFLQGAETDSETVATLRSAIDAEESVTVEIRNYRADGTPFWNELTVTPVYDTEGELVRYLGTQRDVTDRIERERELRQFKLAVEVAGHAIYVTDADGTIEYVNPAFESLTGYAAADAVGRTPRILKSGVQDAAYYDSLWASVTAGETWEESVVNETATGERYHAVQTIAPITDADGTVEKFVAIQRDVTDRKAYERELERKTDRLDRFASVVSHDLRNPLTVADGRVELARRTEDCDHLAPASRALDRMGSLIEDLLLVTREGDRAVDPTPVSLATAANRGWETVETADASLSVGVSRRILADESTLQQILENLFRNAVEHGSATQASSPPEGTVEHGPTNPHSQVRDDAGEHGHESVTVTVGATADGFYVADDGPGFEALSGKSVLDSGVTTSDDGTGLGLWIVKLLASAHDWTVSVGESATGGARVDISGVAFDESDSQS